MAKGKKHKAEEEKSQGPVIENRKARYDYAILDTMEVGMILRGSEVKSIRDGKCSLAEGFVRVEGAGVKVSVKAKQNDQPPTASAAGGPPGAKKRMAVRRPPKPGLYLHSVNIAEYPPAGPTGSAAQHKPTRTRTLLAHKRELDKLAKQVDAKGMTLVPLKIYFKNGVAKLLVGVARGKAAHDKRESIARRDAQRDMARAMARRI